MTSFDHGYIYRHNWLGFKHPGAVFPRTSSATQFHAMNLTTCSAHSPPRSPFVPSSNYLAPAHLESDGLSSFSRGVKDFTRQPEGAHIVHPQVPVSHPVSHPKSALMPQNPTETSDQPALLTAQCCGALPHGSETSPRRAATRRWCLFYHGGLP